MSCQSELIRKDKKDAEKTVSENSTAYEKDSLWGSVSLGYELSL
ncbi:hypothetical protein [Fodinibius halophilus]|nr:hypothetical protein [Fodinibius halophilus]